MRCKMVFLGGSLVLGMVLALAAAAESTFRPPHIFPASGQAWRAEGLPGVTPLLGSPLMAGIQPLRGWPSLSGPYAGQRWQRCAFDLAAAGQGDAQPGLILSLKKVFESEGIPPRWVWMAEVESALNPQARSPVGAVGLFQLMPATAQRFGLRISPLDDRTQPHKNSRAAAQYLKILYRQFESWPLALAAYNAGEGRVRRAMQQHGSVSFHELAQHLPRETQLYVPKVMSTVALREDQAQGLPAACCLSAPF